MIKPKVKYKFLLTGLGIIIALVLIEVLLRCWANIYTQRHLPKYNFSKIEARTYKIVCLGDSYTYGIGAGFANSYPAQLEKILNEKAGKKKFEVFNLGMPGCNSTQAVKTLQDSLVNIKPDIVIILVGCNDNWNFKSVLFQSTCLGLKFKALLSSLKIYRLFYILFQDLKNLMRRVFPETMPATFSYQRLENDKSDAQKLIRRGNIYRDNNYLEQAKLYYQKALRLDPQNKVASLELGRSYKLNAEYEKAQEIFLAGFRLDADDEVLQNELADLVIKQNKIEKTLQYYSSLLDEFPNNDYVRKQLSNACVQVGGDFYLDGQSEKALPFYKRAYKLDPENKRAYWYLVNYGFDRYSPKLDFKKETTKLIFSSEAAVLVKLMQSQLLITPQTAEEVSRKILFENLVKIIKLCEKFGVILIFSSYPSGASLTMQEAAVAYHIPLVDHKSTFAELLTNSPLTRYQVSEFDPHCTKEGYRVMAENMSKVVLRYVQP